VLRVAVSQRKRAALSSFRIGEFGYFPRQIASKAMQVRFLLHILKSIPFGCFIVKYFQKIQPFRILLHESKQKSEPA